MRAFITLAVVCAALLGCIDDGGECPPPEPLDFFQSGQYSSSGGEPVDWYCPEGCATVFPPHEGVSSLDMDIDLEEGVVTIEYDRHSRHVVERWRITGHHPR